MFRWMFLPESKLGLVRVEYTVSRIQDEILDKRNLLIGKLEKQMSQKTSQEGLFTIRWQVI
jgi:hypothetical protein